MFRLIDKILYYLPQTIVMYFAIEIFILVMDSDLYCQLFQRLDYLDAILCFTAFAHLITILYRKIVLTERYAVSWITILVITVLNIILDLTQFNIYVYYVIYAIILGLNFTYFIIKDL